MRELSIDDKINIARLIRLGVKFIAVQKHYNISYMRIRRILLEIPPDNEVITAKPLPDIYGNIKY